MEGLPEGLELAPEVELGWDGEKCIMPLQMKVEVTKEMITRRCVTLGGKLDGEYGQWYLDGTKKVAGTYDEWLQRFSQLL